MKLYRVILPVGDIDKAEEFYSQLFGMKGERVSPGRHYFDLGGTILACYDPKADGDDKQATWQPHFNQYIYISTEEIEKIFGNIKKSQTTKDGRQHRSHAVGRETFLRN